MAEPNSTSRTVQILSCFDADAFLCRAALLLQREPSSSRELGRPLLDRAVLLQSSPILAERTVL